VIGVGAKMLEITMKEPHYKVEQVAEMWTMSPDTVRRIFLEEPGVIRYARPRSKYKRSYSTILIPESVLIRVYRRMVVAA
jgi:hypothetical protein